MKRLAEIDFARGSALLMMLVSNVITDLQVFYNYTSHSSFWKAFALITAFLFVFIAGISLSLSYAKTKGKFSKYLKRGSFIFALGMIITIASFFFIPQNYIRFGVLHLIGISIILAYPFLKADKKIVLVAGIVAVVLGFAIAHIQVNSNYFLFLGLVSNSFSSVDYFPIFPWFGVVLLGIFAGKYFYPKGESILREYKASKLIQWLGRHTLIIYFLHQPILLGLLWLIA